MHGRIDTLAREAHQLAEVPGLAPGRVEDLRQHGLGQRRSPGGGNPAEHHDQLTVDGLVVHQLGRLVGALRRREDGEQVGERLDGEQGPRPGRIVLQDGRALPAEPHLPRPLADVERDDLLGRAAEVMRPERQRRVGDELLQPPAALTRAAGGAGTDAVAFHRAVAGLRGVGLEPVAGQGEAPRRPLGHPPAEPRLREPGEQVGGLASDLAPAVVERGLQERLVRHRETVGHGMDERRPVFGPLLLPASSQQSPRLGRIGRPQPPEIGEAVTSGAELPKLMRLDLSLLRGAPRTQRFL